MKRLKWVSKHQIVRDVIYGRTLIAVNASNKITLLRESKSMLNRMHRKKRGNSNNT